MAVILACSAFANQQLWGLMEPDTPTRITLRVYNYAEVPASVLRRAERQMDRIFNRFGVETTWLYCPTSPEQLVSNRACSGRLGPNDLVLKLLPASMSKRYGFRRGQPVRARASAIDDVIPE
jgi:hypothetical protein